MTLSGNTVCCSNVGLQDLPMCHVIARLVATPLAAVKLEAESVYIVLNDKMLFPSFQVFTPAIY